MTNKIKAKNLSRKICKVFKSGYGDTIELKINGEPYQIVDDCNNQRKIKKRKK